MATINLFPNDTVQVDTLVDSSGNAVGGKVNLEEYTVATAPEQGQTIGDLIYVSDGNNGQPTIALWDGSFWRALTTTFNSISNNPGS